MKRKNEVLSMSERAPPPKRTKTLKPAEMKPNTMQDKSPYTKKIVGNTKAVEKVGKNTATDLTATKTKATVLKIKPAENVENVKVSTNTRTTNKKKLIYVENGTTKTSTVQKVSIDRLGSRKRKIVNPRVTRTSSPSSIGKAGLLRAKSPKAEMLKHNENSDTVNETRSKVCKKVEISPVILKTMKNKETKSVKGGRDKKKVELIGKGKAKVGFKKVTPIVKCAGKKNVKTKTVLTKVTEKLAVVKKSVNSLKSVTKKREKADDKLKGEPEEKLKMKRRGRPKKTPISRLIIEEEEVDSSDMDEDKRNIRETERALRSLSGEWEDPVPFFSYKQKPFDDDSEAMSQSTSNESAKEEEKPLEVESMEEPVDLSEEHSEESSKEESGMSCEREEEEVFVTGISMGTCDEQDGVSIHTVLNQEVMSTNGASCDVQMADNMDGSWKDEDDALNTEASDTEDVTDTDSPQGSECQENVPLKVNISADSAGDNALETLLKIEMECATIQSKLPEISRDSPSPDCVRPSSQVPGTKEVDDISEENQNVLHTLQREIAAIEPLETLTDLREKTNDPEQEDLEELKHVKHNVIVVEEKNVNMTKRESDLQANQNFLHTLQREIEPLETLTDLKEETNDLEQQDLEELKHVEHEVMVVEEKENMTKKESDLQEVSPDVSMQIAKEDETVEVSNNNIFTPQERDQTEMIDGHVLDDDSDDDEGKLMIDTNAMSSTIIEETPSVVVEVGKAFNSTNAVAERFSNHVSDKASVIDKLKDLTSDVKSSNVLRYVTKQTSLPDDVLQSVCAKLAERQAHARQIQVITCYYYG